MKVKIKRYIKIENLIVVLAFFGASCAHNTNVVETRKVIDQSYEEKPEWIKKDDVTWVDSTNVYYKYSYTLRGDQRVNACYELARLGLVESIVSEINSKVRAENNLASEGTSENENELINKSLNESLSGYLRGVKIKSRAFERYVVGDVERIDCHVMSEISKTDYAQMKRSGGKALLSVADKVASAVREKQKRFFDSDDQSGEEPKPQSVENKN